MSHLNQRLHVPWHIYHHRQLVLQVSHQLVRKRLCRHHVGHIVPPHVLFVKLIHSLFCYLSSFHASQCIRSFTLSSRSSPHRLYAFPVLIIGFCPPSVWHSCTTSLYMQFKQFFSIVVSLFVVPYAAALPQPILEYTTPRSRTNSAAPLW